MSFELQCTIDIAEFHFGRGLIVAPSDRRLFSWVHNGITQPRALDVADYLAFRMRQAGYRVGEIRATLTEGWFEFGAQADRLEISVVFVRELAVWVIDLKLVADFSKGVPDLPPESEETPRAWLALREALVTVKAFTVRNAPTILS